MLNNRIVLNEGETLELIALGISKDGALNERQAKLVTSLLGTILIQLREVFINQPDATGTEINIASTKNLCSSEELNGELPFFLSRVNAN